MNIDELVNRDVNALYLIDGIYEINEAILMMANWILCSQEMLRSENMLKNYLSHLLYHCDISLH
jgi:hypothetical protein